MKTSTLLKIQSGLENVLGVQSKCTVNRMKDQVRAVAGHCRTRRSAAEALAAEMGYSLEQWPSIRDFISCL